MNKTSNSMLKWKTKMMIMKLTAEAFILIVLFTLDVSKGLFVATIVTINTLLTIIEYYTGCQYIKTISLLVKKVQAMNPNKHLSIKKTNVYEIDSLAEEFESLNSKVADCSSKLSQIIELLNMPIAAFEYKKNEDMVYCTVGFR